MKRLEEVTQDELNKMAKYHMYTTYATHEYNEVMQLIRDWVNPNVSNCSTCNGGVAKFKNQLNELYLVHRVRMQEIINSRVKEEQPIVTEPVKEELKEPPLNYDKNFNDSMNNMLENDKSMFKNKKKK